MSILSEIQNNLSTLKELRHQFHHMPEMAFEEHKTSDLVSQKLESYGISSHRGLAGTGVVGTLITDSGGPSIGLRADMDALPIQEDNNLSYASGTPGKMHACGHDGHMVMLLGAASYLAETRRFKGTVNFIFQPAEENVAGGRVMVEDGLFDLFDCDSIYALHNTPGLPVGVFAIHDGPVMAAADMWKLTVFTNGGHAAYPHKSTDPIVIGAQIVTALQTIVSRSINPTDTAVVSVTTFNSGNSLNIISESVEMSGTCRTHKEETRDIIESVFRRTIKAICDQYEVTFKLEYDRRYPPTVNSQIETAKAKKAVESVVEKDQILTDLPPYMGAEDFGWMLKSRPGCYLRIGNGTIGAHGVSLHNCKYDFNDDVLPYGAAFFASIVEQELPQVNLLVAS